MDTRNAVRIALCFTGRYDIPDRSLTVSGVDMHGNPVTENIPDVDVVRLEHDVNAIIDGGTLMPPSGFNIRGEPVR